jgi:hypothetical protein
VESYSTGDDGYGRMHRMILDDEWMRGRAATNGNEMKYIPG